MRKLCKEKGLGVIEIIVLLVAIFICITAVFLPVISVRAKNVTEVKNEKEIQETWINPEYVKYVKEICKKYHMSPEFVIAFIEAESSGVPTAINGSCHGLMQVYTAVHKDRMKRLGVSNIYDPYQNILVGVDILAELFERYGDDTVKITMMYNGSSDAKQRAENWNFTDYANKVLNRAADLEKLHYGM